MITKEQKELFRKKVGKLLEQRRLEKGMSRKQLGEALGYEGNSAIQVVARFESGRAGVPKAKIGQLLTILEIKNQDFGLSGSKSLKTFISASGFLGSTMAPWSDAMVDFLESSEANFVTQTLEDDDESGEQDVESQTELYQDLLRIMRLYRVQKIEPEMSLLEKLDMVDNLSGGDEDKFSEMLVTLKINPLEAYQTIEGNLVDRLKGAKQ